MAQETLRGDEFRLYRSTDFTTPVWDECDNVKSVTPKFSKEKLKTHRRGRKTAGYRAGVQDVELSLTTEYRATDADRDALDSAYDAETALTYGIFNDDVTTSGTKGWKVEMIVTSVGDPQPHGEIVELTYEMAPADGTDEPARVTIA